MTATRTLAPYGCNHNKRKKKVLEEDRMKLGSKARSSQKKIREGIKCVPSQRMVRTSKFPKFGEKNYLKKKYLTGT